MQLAWARLAASGASRQLFALWERTTVCLTDLELWPSRSQTGLLLTRLILALGRSLDGCASFSSAPSRSRAKRTGPTGTALGLL